MKLLFVKNPKAQVREDERAFVNEITEPFKLTAGKIIIAAFIVLPVLYLVVMENPKAVSPPAAEQKKEATQEVKATENKTALKAAMEKASTDSSFESHFQLSFELYKAGLFEQSILQAEKALAINPKSEAAYNNICSAYNELKNYEKAIEACKKALELNPDFQLAKNNLKWAEEQKLKTKN